MARLSHVLRRRVTPTVASAATTKNRVAIHSRGTSANALLDVAPSASSSISSRQPHSTCSTTAHQMIATGRTRTSALPPSARFLADPWFDPAQLLGEPDQRVELPGQPAVAFLPMLAQGLQLIA